MNTYLNEEQKIKICYHLKPGFNIEKINNITYEKHKNEMILL